MQMSKRLWDATTALAVFLTNAVYFILIPKIFSEYGEAVRAVTVIIVVDAGVFIFFIYKKYWLGAVAALIGLSFYVNYLAHA